MTCVDVFGGGCCNDSRLFVSLPPTQTQTLSTCEMAQLIDNALNTSIHSAHVMHFAGREKGETIKKRGRVYR